MVRNFCSKQKLTAQASAEPPLEGEWQAGHSSVPSQQRCRPIIMNFPETLEEFHSTLQTGCSAQDFLSCIKAKFQDYVWGNGLGENYREGAGAVKKLRDEIIPLSSFLSSQNNIYKHIQMPLDSGADDAYLTDSYNNKKSVQITVTNARERTFLAKELNATGEGSGFIGALDNDKDFNKKLNAKRICYTTEQFQKHLIQSIAQSIERKAMATADIFIISYHGLHELHAARITEILPTLCKLVADVHIGYDSVYLVGDSIQGLSYQLK